MVDTITASTAVKENAIVGRRATKETPDSQEVIMPVPACQVTVCSEIGRAADSNGDAK